MNTSHPKALPILFLTEMWERFSYYGMRALLVLYAVKFLGFSDRSAGQLYGAYTGLVYLTPIIGGWLSDRFLGLRRSILIGGVLMGLGHLSLAFEEIEFFFFGLFLLVVGNGFFKPNMSSLVGSLYEKNESMRDSGYTIFYMGINLGGFLGPIICGSLGEKMDWHYGFGAAGIGMGIGVLVFYFGQKLLPSHIGIKPEKKIISDISRIKLSSIEWNRIKTILVLSFFSIFFWAAFEQAGSSMNLFADRYVDRSIGEWMIPASVFQSVNPIFILIFAPIFAKMWTSLARRNKEPDKPIKFALGLVLLSLGFACLVLGARQIALVGFAGMHYLLLAYLFNTLGELCLSPVGLSMVSELAPNHLTSMMMGIWFLSNAIAHYLGGVFSGMVSEIPLTVFFGVFIGFAISSALILLLIRPTLNSWMSHSKSQ